MSLSAAGVCKQNSCVLSARSSVINVTTLAAGLADCSIREVQQQRMSDRQDVCWFAALGTGMITAEILIVRPLLLGLGSPLNQCRAVFDEGVRGV